MVERHDHQGHEMSKKAHASQHEAHGKGDYQRNHALCIQQCRGIRLSGQDILLGARHLDRHHAPALAQADVGIAVGAGTDVAVETADIVLVRSSPLDVMAVVDLARATYRKMVQNLAWATGYNAFAIPLAAGVLYTYGVLLSPAMGAILMSLSTVIVAINARFLKIRKSRSMTEPVPSFSLKSNSLGSVEHTHRISGDEKMSAVKVTQGILTILIGTVVGFHGAAYAHVPEYLQHDIESAQRSFERRCTECHSINTALSSRAYRDWLTGIAQRHGKGSGWIPEEEAKQIFLHLIVHLEPNLKTAVQAEMVEPEENWQILICLIGGFTTLALLITTLVFGHNKALRRRWFKGHSYFATATLIAAIIHGTYCFYIFGLD